MAGVVSFELFLSSCRLRYVPLQIRVVFNLVTSSLSFILTSVFRTFLVDLLDQRGHLGQVSEGPGLVELRYELVFGLLR